MVSRRSRAILWWVFGGLLVAMLGMGACCGVGMWWFGTEVDELKRQQAVLADRRARAVVIPASQLIQEVQGNTEAAEQKYARKYLEVTGVVERTGKDDNGIRFAILHGGDANAKIKIECYFDFINEHGEIPVPKLEEGQTVTLRGEFRGRISHIQIRECEVLK
jgi:hypothetical protein